MGDYIERQAVLNAYDAVQRKNGPWRFETLIESVPAADVRPVVRGRWVRTRQVELNPFWSLENCGTQYMCSECGRRAGYKQVTLYKFCPNCGADMRGGTEQ